MISDDEVKDQPLDLANEGKGAEVQRAVLAWLAEDSSRGYAAASRRFGVPYDTIKGWARAIREGRQPARANARTAARAHAPAREEPVEPRPWDPATCTRREYLEVELRRAIARVDMHAQHGGVARQWAETAQGLREELDDLLQRDADAAERARRHSAPDVDGLVGRVLALAPVLARVAPAQVERLIAALQAALPRDT